MLDRNTNGTECSPCQRESENDNGVCCIDTYRIYDSCRNQECIENLRIMVTDEGQRILDSSSNIRVKSVRVLWTKISTEEMPFNKGYFQIETRYYFYCVLDCCACMGNGQEIPGLCVYDKTVILYGGEGNISTFQSDIFPDSSCVADFPSVHSTTHHPRAVVEVAEPIALRLNVLSGERNSDFGESAINCESIPEQIASVFRGSFSDVGERNKVCYVCLGLFSMVRIERPAQLVIPACDFCIPDKNGECDIPYTDPCSLFRSMTFPVNEFYPATNAYSPITAQMLQTQTAVAPLDPKKYK